jgi:glutathione reductase (NADPH)
MMKNFDLIALGTGSAAATVASQCRAAGWEVAIVDSRPYGGTCALRGCDPKKVLVGAAEAVDWVRRMEKKGVASKGVRIDWTSLMRFKKTFTDPLPKAREQGFRKRKIGTFHGRARFVGRAAIEVGRDTLVGKHILIATGAHPATLSIPGGEHLITSDQFLELKKLPRRVVFVGGGYISFEFAHVAARAGSAAVIVHRGSRPLVGFDPDLVATLVRASEAIGIRVHVKTAVEAIEKKGGRFVVTASRDGKNRKLEADLVVHGAGRVPEIEALDLQKAGIEHSRKGISVNEYLQSVSNAAVYAAGDAAATEGLPLTPVASMEGRVVAANLLDGNHQKPNYAGVPSVVFTVPPLAGVGLQEAAAREQGLRVKVNQGDTSDWYSSRRVGVKHSGYKVLVDEETNRILGAHLLGPHAEETINLFALAIRFGMTAEQLKEMRYAYPSHSDDVSYMV